jgi:hypothetical protein
MCLNVETVCLLFTVKLLPIKLGATNLLTGPDFGNTESTYSR